MARTKEVWCVEVYHGIVDGRTQWMRSKLMTYSKARKKLAEYESCGHKARLYEVVKPMGEFK
jgi:hypothetical protein